MLDDFPNLSGPSAETKRAQSEDAGALDRVRRRDPSAMTEIFDRYARMAYAIALRVVKDAPRAEDIVQDVFFHLWENPGAFAADRGSLGAWIAVVARNRAIDMLRRQRPSDPVEDVALPAVGNLATEVERHRMMERVREILNALPREQRQSVELAFFDGLTHSEIAARTGEPLGTVKTRIRAALTSVRRAFQA